MEMSSELYRENDVGIGQRGSRIRLLEVVGGGVTANTQLSRWNWGRVLDGTRNLEAV